MFNQPQPLYLYGEVREYIKIEGRIFGDSVKEQLENITFVASNQMNQDANINNRPEYQVTKNQKIKNYIP